MGVHVPLWAASPGLRLIGRQQMWEQLSDARVSAVRCAPSRVETQLPSGDGSRD